MGGEKRIRCRKKRRKIRVKYNLKRKNNAKRAKKETIVCRE
jgi:hypothetical protein